LISGFDIREFVVLRCFKEDFPVKGERCLMQLKYEHPTLPEEKGKFRVIVHTCLFTYNEYVEDNKTYTRIVCLNHSDPGIPVPAWASKPKFVKSFVSSFNMLNDCLIKYCKENNI
jgi:hypothetical protein